jgi:hypothetical protein
MILISHRGNLNGKILEQENKQEYIDTALNLGFDVEIDIRYSDGNLYLGHDVSKYLINLKWLMDRKHKLWIHCKNHQAIEYLNGKDLNWFWHDNDDMTLTSKGFIWSHPKIQPLKNSIAVLPDNYKWNLKNCIGICSDHINQYKK